jgi:hypothetical protein
MIQIKSLWILRSIRRAGRWFAALREGAGRGSVSMIDPPI